MREQFSQGSNSFGVRCLLPGEDMKPLLSPQTFKSAFLVMIASTFLIVDVQSQSRVPQFKDYPVRETYTGKTAPVVLMRNDRRWRTVLREAWKEKPNFAGGYILTALRHELSHGSGD